MKILKYSILTVIIGFGLLYVSYNNAINKPINNLDDERSFVISRGETTEAIVNKLNNEGFIKSRKFVKFYIWNNNLSSSLQAGTYQLSATNNSREILNKIIKGETEGDDMNMKIIEGWTIADIDNYLVKLNIKSENDQAIASTSIEDEIIKNSSLSFLHNVPKDANLEGYLFPDTYTIYLDANKDDVISRMLSNFETKLNNEMRDSIKAQGKNIHDIVIMASLVEKEVQDAEEMKIVSGIFWNRLESNMRLESDATLTYILNDKVSAHKASDLSLDSPYNSYKYGGLPPTPIGNPGLNAIMAAIYPAKTDYLFFLTGKGGKTHFSKDYEGHLKNKKQYLD